MPRVTVCWIGGLALLLSLFPPKDTHAQSRSAPTVQSDTVALSPTGRVEIENTRGSIDVTTWDRAQVAYEVRFAPAEGDSAVYSMPDIDRSEEAISFGNGSSWSIRIPGVLTISPEGTREPAGHYRVVMPKTARLDIDDQSSQISVSGVRADVSVSSYEGEVSIRDVEGMVTLETYRDTARVAGLRGGIDLETYSGTVTVDFAAFTSESAAETYSGPLRFVLPVDTGFTLATELTDADVVVDDIFGPSSATNEDETAYNGGGPRLDLESYSGNIEIRPRSTAADSSSR